MQSLRYFWLRRRPYSYRYEIRRERRGVQLLLSGAFGIGLALLLIHAFDVNIRPIVIEMAKAGVNSAVIQIVDSAVNTTLAEQAIAYQDMVTLQTDHSGRITALTSNSTEINRLRSEIMDDITSQVNLLDSGELGIPFGNLTPFTSLSGKGPVLPVRVLSVGTTEAAFCNVFTDAGINQTYHQIKLDVTVSLTLLIPGGTVETAVSTQINVAETVIVGQVPDAYMQFGSAK